MMTVKRQWMLVLIITAIISVGINSLVLSSLINRYFVNYTAQNYEKHLDQLVELSKKALKDKSYTSQQLAVQLEAHLSDPITRIRLYDKDGRLLANVGSNIGRNNGMMNGRMMNRMMGPISEETDSTDITDSGTLLGKLNITRYSTAGNSLETRMFKLALIGNSLFSIGLVLIFVLLVGIFVSRKMSKDLMQTAAMATNIDLGNPIDNKKSGVNEIRIIQQSLETLQSRLKLKQTSRKRLVDELVHQARTPLTILKTHLEGFEDGVINMTPEEIKTCEAQVENITAIISNMSGMIDAEKDIEIIKLEEFELSQLIKQITGGLRAQFDKKQLALEVLSHEKIQMKTGKYKLSQCIYNLLTNAYKFTGTGGRISIDYGLRNEEVSITIEDSGTGINAEDIDKLFNAYFRGSNSVDIDGEGIGLYVVRENLNKIKGTVTVESEPGKGSSFTMKLPRTIDE